MLGFLTTSNKYIIYRYGIVLSVGNSVCQSGHHGAGYIICCFCDVGDGQSVLFCCVVRRAGAPVTVASTLSGYSGLLS